MRQLVIMVKEPHLGRVKTRLGAGLGRVGATWWFRHQSQSLIRRLGRDPRWQTYLAVSPDHEGITSPIWPSDMPRIPQGTGNLGDRMARILRGFQGKTMIIGSDIPEIQTHHIEAGFRALGSNPAVFGPAPDGGYWLIGTKHGSRLPKSALQNVRWSSAHALADSQASLPFDRFAQLEQLQDIDTIEDLRTLQDKGL